MSQEREGSDAGSTAELLDSDLWKQCPRASESSRGTVSRLGSRFGYARAHWLPRDTSLTGPHLCPIIPSSSSLHFTPWVRFLFPAWLLNSPCFSRSFYLNNQRAQILAPLPSPPSLKFWQQQLCELAALPASFSGCRLCCDSHSLGATVSEIKAPGSRSPAMTENSPLTSSPLEWNNSEARFSAVQGSELKCSGR